MNNDFITFLINQNPDRKITAALRLNQIFLLFEKTDFYKQFVSSASFDLNPFSLEWEYTVDFKIKKGFVIFLEDENNLDLIRVFVYPKGDEILLNPTKIINCSGILDDSLNSHFTKFWEDEMSSIYSELI